MQGKDNPAGKVVLTYGTFDLFHMGHHNLLRNLKALGTTLIVGVSTDDFNASKGKKTVIPYEHRVQIIESIRYVDLAIAETCWEQKRADIARFEVDIFAMGDDWMGKFDFLRDLCEVIYLPRTRGVSTTEIKDQVQRQFMFGMRDPARFT
jgi:glycerol-3-phosphate cytidylyltransferase